MAKEPWTAAPGGIVIEVRLTPRGGRDAIEGTERLADGRAVLKARVRAVPFEGAANAALCHLIGRTLGVAVAKVTIAGGAASRIKRVRVAGESGALMAALKQMTEDR